MHDGGRRRRVGKGGIGALERLRLLGLELFYRRNVGNVDRRRMLLCERLGAVLIQDGVDGGFDIGVRVCTDVLTRLLARAFLMSLVAAKMACHESSFFHVSDACRYELIW